MKKIFLILSFLLFIIQIGTSQDLPSNIPTNGLIAYYPFNGNANDESGNSNNGSVLGASLSGDRFGNENSAYTFNGIDDFIVTQNSIAFAKQTYTFSFWAKTENGAKNMSALSQNCDDDCDKAYSLVINKFLNSAVECEYGHMGSSPQSFGYAQPAHYGIVNTITSGNVWKNYVLVVGSEDNYLYNNFRFYVNGIQIDTNCNHNWDSWEYDFPNYPMVIGKGNNSIIEGFFDGQLDDIAVWDRALSFNEIKALYDLPPGILLNGTVSAENNQIKNVADPTEAQDVVTKAYIDALIAEAIAGLQSQLNALQNSSSVTDIDGNSYDYLTYGDQVWTVENSETETYRDGTPIPQVTDVTEWQNLTTGAWCYYDNDPTKGKLYNWYAAAGIHDNDPNTPNKELAPEGWHVPTDAEWKTLENYLIANGYNYDGTTTENKIAKAMASTSGWDIYNSNNGGVPSNDQSLNNSSGFNAYPKGGLGNLGYSDDPDKPGDGSAGGIACFWSTTMSSNDAYCYYLAYHRSDLARGINPEWQGFSVRFIRD